MQTPFLPLVRATSYPSNGHHRVQKELPNANPGCLIAWTFPDLAPIVANSLDGANQADAVEFYFPIKSVELKFRFAEYLPYSSESCIKIDCADGNIASKRTLERKHIDDAPIHSMLVDETRAPDA